MGGEKRGREERGGEGWSSSFALGRKRKVGASNARDQVCKRHNKNCGPFGI